MIDVNKDENGIPTWGVVPEDPVIQALLATGAPMAPQGGPPGMTPPSPLPFQPNDLAFPQDPYQAQGRPGPDVSTQPVVPPQAPIPDAGPGYKPADVAGAAAGENTALTDTAKSVEDAALAKTNALAATAGRKAEVYEGHAKAQGLVDNQYQIARAAARKDADAETAAWMRDIEQKTRQEPSPSHWFESQNSFGKILFTLSLAFGALAQSKNPAIKNIGLEMINAEVDADMQRQKEKLARQMEAAKMKGQRIDAKLAQRLADAKDDHTLMAERMATIQQAAMERAQAPGPEDQRAAYAAAAQWASEKRFEIAGKRSDRAYLERENKLNRDAENARSYMTDKRDRDLAKMTSQEHYDLAGVRFGMMADKAAKGPDKLKDTRTLSPDITGLRVLDVDTGKPVGPHSGGGLVVSDKVEKDVINLTKSAQEHYATLKRISKELEKDEDWATLLKRNPQLQSDLTTIGYQTAKENDPGGRITDKDFVSGVEQATGGDLLSLKGRIAAGTFSAGQGKLKEIVDKQIRDMPARISNTAGAYVDASIPGYEGKVRVDWTPKAVEIDEPKGPSPKQTDSTYGISGTIRSPNDLAELERAQKLTKAGAPDSLPPYKPGVESKVVKTLADFEGVTPEKIAQRAEAAKKSVAGDQRAVLEIEQAKQAETKKAAKHLSEFKSHMNTAYGNKLGYRTEGEVEVKGADMVETATKLSKKYGLTQLSGDDIVDLLKSMDIPTVDTKVRLGKKSEEPRKFE